VTWICVTDPLLLPSLSVSWSTAVWRRVRALPPIS